MTPIDTGITHFANYDPATGRIAYTGSVPTSMLSLQGNNVVEGDADLTLDYVENGAITPRPANTATLDGMTLKNLPNPCTINVEGVAHACTDPTADLSFSHPGTFTVTVSAWPMLDATFSVTQA